MFNRQIIKQNLKLLYCRCALRAHQFIDRARVFVFDHCQEWIFVGWKEAPLVPEFIANLAHAFHARSAIRSA